MATKSTNSTLWTLGVLGILGFAAYEYFTKKHFNGGGGGSGGGAIGGVNAPYPYNPDQQQQQPGISFQFGGNNGPAGGKATLNPPGPSDAPQSISDALFSGQYDAASENALATIYNAQTGFSTEYDAPINYGAAANLPELSNETVNAQPTDTSSIFDSFTNWWNSFTGNDLTANTGPSGSDISQSELSDYSNSGATLDSGDYSGSGDIGGDTSGGSDLGDYGGGETGDGGDVADYGGDSSGDNSGDYSSGDGGDYTSEDGGGYEA